MNDCPKLANPRKPEEDHYAPKCPGFKTPDLVEENCYFGANMENQPLKWNLTEAQKKVIETYTQVKKRIQPKIEQKQQYSSKYRYYK